MNNKNNKNKVDYDRLTKIFINPLLLDNNNDDEYVNNFIINYKQYLKSIKQYFIDIYNTDNSVYKRYDATTMESAIYLKLDIITAALELRHHSNPTYRLFYSRAYCDNYLKEDILEVKILLKKTINMIKGN